MKFLMLLAVPAILAQQTEPFVLPWDDTAPGVTNVSRWNRKSAGDFVKVGKDGHLYAGNERIRFLGVNTCFGASFPEKPDAEKIAARMAKFGINCVRFHHMDMSPFPNGILDRKSKNTRALDPEALDRLDYFISQLKKNGIYVNLNTLVSRQFRAADGLPPEIEKLDWKDRASIGFFYKPIVDLQKEYAQQLLAHMNKYTGVPYCDEPAVAFVEINNENGLIQSWLSGALDDIPEVLHREFACQWNEYLTKKYKDTDALKRAWSDKVEPLGNELLKNGPFENGTDKWNLEQHEGAAATLSVEDDIQERKKVAVLNVTKKGTATWHVQLNQTSLAVKSGKAYALTFMAKTGDNVTISVNLGQAHDPWKIIGFNSPLKLTREWKRFAFTLRPNEDDDNARVNFSGMGLLIGSFYFADVSFKPGGGNPGLADGESLKNVPTFTKANFGERTKSAQTDWIAFLRETEERYWLDLYNYYKKDLKVKAVVVGTIAGCSTPSLMSQLDAIDTHGYWQHPQFPARPWDQENWFVQNTSMANFPGGVPAQMSAFHVIGKPHICTEYNHSAPNTFSSEAPIFISAYAALQDWDGIFMFAYSHRNGNWDSEYFTSFFDIDQHPAKMANMLVARTLFCRADVSAANETIARPISVADEIEFLRRAGQPWWLVNISNVGVDPNAATIHRVGIGPLTETRNILALGRKRLESDTGELVWDVARKDKGVLTINTARAKAVVGFIDSREFKLGDVTIKPGTTMQDWCTISLVAMEGDFKTGKILVVATGYSENTGMKWKNEQKNSVGKDWGKSPSRIEIVPAEITLPAAAKDVQAWSLDERGQRKNKLKVSEKDGQAVVTIGKPEKTLWYEIEAD